MSMRYPGGLLTAATPVNAQYPSGVWTQAQTIPYVQQNVWQRDVYWPYTTLLLHGDGTNGAQNNTFLDSSSNNFTITRNGNTTQGSFTPFQQDGYWSNYFDGSGDYLQWATTVASTNFGTGSYTIEFWVNAPLNNDKFFLDLRGPLNNMHITTGGVSSTAGVLRAVVGGNTILSSNVVTDNTWHHCAIVRNGSSAVTLYVDGVSVGSGTDSTNYAGANSTGYVSKNSLGTNELTGYLSNIRIVKGTAVYTSNFTPSNAPLTAISGTQLLTCQSNRFIDNSANAFAITVNGNTAVQAFQPFPGFTTWSPSVLGGSGYFDGSGDYLNFAAGNSSITNWYSQSTTLEMWVYPTASVTYTNNYPALITNASVPSNTNYWGFGLNGLKVRFAYFSGSSQAIESSGSVRLNSWNHIAFVHNSSDSSIKIYVNGTLDGSGTKTGTPQSDASFGLLIGAWFGGSFAGYISNARIVTGSAVYTSNFTPSTTPLTAITNTSLLLSYTNAGIFDNAQMNNLETVGNAQVSTSVVKYGTGSMAFDGSGDWLAGPPTPQTDLGSGDFTLEAWLYRTASGAASDSGIVSRGAPSTSNGFVFGYTSSNVLTFNFNYSGAIVTGVTVIPANTWTHVAVSRNGNTFRLFVNGVLDATATSTNSQTTNASDIFYVGRSGYDSGRIMTGYIDDLRITKGVARYITNFTPPIARMPNQ